MPHNLPPLFITGPVQLELPIATAFLLSDRQLKLTRLFALVFAVNSYISEHPHPQKAVCERPCSSCSFHGSLAKPLLNLSSGFHNMQGVRSKDFSASEHRINPTSIHRSGGRSVFPRQIRFNISMSNLNWFVTPQAESTSRVFESFRSYSQLKPRMLERILIQLISAHSLCDWADVFRT